MNIILLITLPILSINITESDLDDVYKKIIIEYPGFEKKILEDFLEDDSKIAHVGPDTWLRRCLEANKKSDKYTEALAFVALLANHPDSLETGFAVKTIEPENAIHLYQILFGLDFCASKRTIAKKGIKSTVAYFNHIKACKKNSNLIPWLAFSPNRAIIKPEHLDSATDEDKILLEVLQSGEDASQKCLILKNSKNIFYSPLIYFIYLEHNNPDKTNLDRLITEPISVALISTCCFDKAMKILESLPAPQSAESAFLLGWVRAFTGNREGALEAFRNIANLDPDPEWSTVADLSQHLVSHDDRFDRELTEFLRKAFVEFKALKPKSIKFNYKYPLKNDQHAEGGIVICPEINYVSGTMYIEDELVYFQESSIFGTKILSPDRKNIYKNDLRLIFPYFDLSENKRMHRSLYKKEIRPLNKIPFNMVSFSEFLESRNIFTNDASIRNLLLNSYSKGIYYDLLKDEKYTSIIAYRPNFEELYLEKCAFKFDKKFNLVSIQYKGAEISNIEYSNKIIDKPHLKKQLDLPQKNMAKNFFTMASYDFLKFDSKYGSMGLLD